MSVAVFADGEHVHVIIDISTTTAATATTATIAMIATTFVLFLDSAEAAHVLVCSGISRRTSCPSRFGRSHVLVASMRTSLQLRPKDSAKRKA